MTGARELDTTRREAREIFDAALAAVDARRAVLDSVRLEGPRLEVGGAEFDLGGDGRRVYAVALGKAGFAMASALDALLGARLARGVVSAPAPTAALSARWRVYEGGHPLPNEASLAAARSALELLREADEASGLVLFLVSGGGSAMLELPRDSRVTLADLREANRALVGCGAPISEVNAVRRALSMVKGGGLASAAGRAGQVTLIVSDTNEGRERDVASGPTLAPDEDSPDPREVVARRGLSSLLPRTVLDALDTLEDDESRHGKDVHGARRECFVLLDNGTARGAAAGAGRRLGYAVETADDLVEQPVTEGSAELVARLARAYRSGRGGRGVCLVSGGEFACPVRGAGVGGRNAETALRCAFEFEQALSKVSDGGAGPGELAALCAGTDGVDGNSPAAGAFVDRTTLRRARAAGLSPERSLEESDAFTLFDALGDALVTGPTGTNVRDLRILIAK